MNLQENIDRIRSMMGIITENDGPSKIDRMINDIGLGSTIKFFGGYENFKEVYGGHISNEDKVNFISQLIKEKISQEGEKKFIRVIDYANTLPYLYSDDGMTKTVEYLYPTLLRSNVYRMIGNTYVYDGMVNIKYDELNDEQLDIVFKIILKII